MLSFRFLQNEFQSFVSDFFLSLLVINFTKKPIKTRQTKPKTATMIIVALELYKAMF